MIVCLLRLVVRTSGFHPDNSSSILLGDAKKNAHLKVSIFFSSEFCFARQRARIFLLRKKNSKTRVRSYKVLARNFLKCGP